MEQQTKTKAKKMAMPLMVGIMMLALVSAGMAIYFHTVNATVVATEGRQSTDVDFPLNCYSGETVSQTLTIVNVANVPLATEFTFNETSNPNGVIYTHNLPMKVVTDALSTGTYTANFTCNEVTEAGTVTGTIYYNPVEI